MATKRPSQIYTPDSGWHYAATKEKAVCPTKDMFCYFLKISSCEPDLESYIHKGFVSETRSSVTYEPGTWYLEYATRQQTWLRREVYDFSNKVNMTTPCTVAHVRRSDVVLRSKRARQYREIDEYVNAMDNSTQNILLLTDDHNAIGEAKAKFPDKNWMYIDRPRHRGAEGGWENQIPSGDPKLEVIVLLTIFRLVKQCNTLVHSKSGFADLLRREMGNDATYVNLDEGKRVFNPDHVNSVNVSRSYDVARV